jgi:hypothetical protein
MRSLCLLAAALAGCASTRYVVDPSVLTLPPEARVPALVEPRYDPVLVEAGALRPDGPAPDGLHAHIINRTMVTGYVFLGIAAIHLIAGLALLPTLGDSCSGNDTCGFGPVVVGSILGPGVAYLIVGGLTVLIGRFARPHEWPRTRVALGRDGVLHF